MRRDAYDDTCYLTQLKDEFLKSLMVIRGLKFLSNIINLWVYKQHERYKSFYLLVYALTIVFENLTVNVILID